MISGTYLAAAGLLILTLELFQSDALVSWSFLIMVVVTFFFASTDSSAAYLTVSEIFPLETRALAITFFYTIGTAAGGIAGALLFGQLIESGSVGQVAIGFYIGVALMAVGGVAEIAVGVNAEQESWEDIAQPLTVQ